MLPKIAPPGEATPPIDEWVRSCLEGRTPLRQCVSPLGQSDSARSTHSIHPAMALLSPQDRYGYCASAVPSAKACGGSFPRKEPCNLHGKRVQLEMRGQPSEGCLSPRGVNLKARRRNANRPYGCESALFAGASKRWSSPAFGASRGAAILESVLPWRPPSVSFRIPSACSTALESWRLLPLAGDNPPPSRPGAPKCLWSSRLSSFRFGGTQSLESEIG